MLQGKVTGVEHERGSGLALLWVQPESEGQQLAEQAIPFDWRCLRDIEEAEGDLVGRQVTYDEETASIDVGP